MKVVWLLLLIALVSIGCGGAMPKPSIARLRVLAVPEKTRVYVDDRFIGTARVLAVKPKSMKPGIKYITFEAQDYFPHDLRVMLPAGTTTIRMKLRPIPP
ncbi:MAG: hypothetical protein JXA30_08610 [Deltaproteobacteria bacterium]|nr:hypothetical protein [Deltaproteobacteria bacterium]